MKLSRLLSAAGLVCPEEREITHLACDSNQVVPGALFAALEGARTDGRAYIPQAVERGAAAVVCREGGEAPVPVIHAPDPRWALAHMAAELHGRPADRLHLIAVTGTKGKTTAAHMIREILTAAGHPTGMMGTLGAFAGEKSIAPPVNTTPEPIALHRLLRQMEEGGCTHAVLEASSQAMKLERLAGLAFDGAVFLNLSPDHIGPGEHRDFAEYRACKAALFRQCRLAVGNAADPAWPYMAAEVPAGAAVRTFGACVCRPGPGLTTRLTLPGEEDYVLPMPGAFNGQNALAAVTLCRALGVEDGAIRTGLGRVRVPGRCMVYPAPAPYGVVIDYAHNGASFAALFAALKERPHRRIIAVFGAGGDRPPMRRHDLARAAAEGADFAVVTEDNPRSEPPENICAQIAGAMPDLPHVIVPDRREAIYYALDMAEPGDIVALLGKGHEEYIETNGIRRHFSEWEVLEEYFGGIKQTRRAAARLV